ncbi:predicted protein [Lichtheimia corymbifera JMRC:FSU:9682]|uniref:Uncharacterized protein n=1 Tax=Lichtheimia corymbifera JMRC:FSU:9682 TaxID=1263082 RepID=A0A068S8U3_9FUNG|nr:predicted protein [Lichtheimia corymbifera JMRC:FSU:9682]
MIRSPGDWDSTLMQGFLTGIAKGCPNISFLEVSCGNAPSTCSMNALKQLAHLERFGFSIAGMDGDDAFWHTIETFSQLKCIHIFSSHSTNMHRLRCFREKRPDLEVIISKSFTEI